MEKMYHSISEASAKTGLPRHVLRYWESVFRELKPKKSKAGTRMYREEDIALLLEIRGLLHEQRYTIEGAKVELERRRAEGSLGREGRREQVLAEAKATIREVLELLG